jgi:hypothetical protein
MELKIIKPAHCAFAEFGNTFENLIPPDAFVFTHAYFSAVNESYSCAFSETKYIKKKHHRNENSVLYLYETIV